MPSFYCKMCGEHKEFETKKEWVAFRNTHRPKLPGPNAGRAYNCKLKSRFYKNKKGRECEVLMRESLWDKFEREPEAQ